jgi:nitrate reductase gamma subunit
MPLPLIYLWIHRKTVDRLNYITSGADIFALVLLLLIALSGITLRLLYHPDVAMVKQFMLGMVLLSPINIPINPIFLIHFSLVIVLGVYFPFSKLLHAGGVFFSPTRTQIENVREVRYINPWASSGEKS